MDAFGDGAAGGSGVGEAVEVAGAGMLLPWRLEAPGDGGGSGVGEAVEVAIVGVLLPGEWKLLVMVLLEKQQKLQE